jgi:hypothetical protein
MNLSEEQDHEACDAWMETDNVALCLWEPETCDRAGEMQNNGTQRYHISPKKETCGRRVDRLFYNRKLVIVFLVEEP